ncbi:MAG: hypothetical protein ACPLRW_13575 [Moorellales bacterium]
MVAVVTGLGVNPVRLALGVVCPQCGEGVTLPFVTCLDGFGFRCGCGLVYDFWAWIVDEDGWVKLGLGLGPDEEVDEEELEGEVAELAQALGVESSSYVQVMEAGWEVLPEELGRLYAMLICPRCDGEDMVFGVAEALEGVRVACGCGFEAEVWAFVEDRRGKVVLGRDLLKEEFGKR